MSAADVILLPLALHLLGGVVPLLGGRARERAGAALSALGSVAGLVGALSAFRAPAAALVASPWNVPGGQILLRVDALSAAFLAVIFVVSGLGAVYGLGYFSAADEPRSAPALRFFYALMTVGLALVVLAANGVLFLLAWELMAVAAFFLVATEDEKPEVRRAAWVYLVATHAGTACLFAAFALLRGLTGTFSLGKVAPGPEASIVFLLGVVGFGLKAGIVPFHFWLPAAHANAPSHVSALMSGVMLKAGVYGILRFSGLVDAPPLWWGLLLAALGAGSAVTGIALASGQTDIKRALAYSSIENIGIIWLGIGLAIAGRALSQPTWVALGFCGALFHVFSHASFKSLLFLGSGGVIHGAGTRDMDRLGGLCRRMPVTSGLFIVGALSAAGLPLLNGFVGEWLVAVGLFDTLRGAQAGGWPLAFGAPALALAGALALASFVRIVGITFLGEPRTPGAAEAHDASPLMTIPMGILAAACVALGIFPSTVLFALNAAQSAWLGHPAGPGLIAGPLAQPLPAFAVLAAVVLAVAAGLLALVRPAARRGSTWSCGYAAASARIQYTSKSFGASIVESLPEFLTPHVRLESPRDFFPRAASFRTEAPDPFGAKLYEPFVARWAARFGRLRLLQRGQLAQYLVYIFVMTLVLLAWSVVRPYVT